MTITLGWWMIPVILTIIAFSIAFIEAKEDGFAFSVYVLMAVFASMSVWLGYFVIREIIGWLGGAK